MGEIERHAHGRSRREGKKRREREAGSVSTKSGTRGRAGHFRASKEGPFVPGFKEKEIKGIKLGNLIFTARPPELDLKKKENWERQTPK